MKTAINQSVTILSLFTLAIVATLAFSWVITQVVYPTQESENISVKTIIIKHVEQEVQQDFTSTFKYLIPKLK